MRTASDADSRVPLPTGATDCHAHVFGPPADYPTAATADYQPAVATADQYAKTLATLGFERMVIVQPSVYGFDNRCTLDGVAALGLDRARAIAMVPPDVPEPELRALDAAGVRGVRTITMASGGPSLDDLETTARRIAPFGWHLQLYVDARTLVGLEPVLARLPVPVVLDHLAGLRADTDVASDENRTVCRLLDSGRCWVKLSGYRASVAGPPYTDVVPLTRRLAEYAPQRCVWGTDWPHPNLDVPAPDDRDLLGLLLDAVPAAATRQRMLVDNPAELYGFETGRP